MIINTSKLSIPDKDLVAYCIPESFRKNYMVLRFSEEKQYAIHFRGQIVAIVKVLDGGALDFSFVTKNPASLYFKSLLENEFLSQGANGELFWLVVFPDTNQTWTYIGRPEKSKELALRWVNANMMDRMCILVSFLRKANVDGWLSVKSANYLSGEWPDINVVAEDMGAKKFRISEVW